MGLKATIDNDIKEAMKAKDQAALRALRAIKSAILLAETAEGKAGAELSEAEEMKLLTKQASQRKDSIAQFEANGRADLAVGEKEELAIIERFLPKGLTEEELVEAVKKYIAEAGATTPADMGKVMKLATPALAGRVDGKLLSEAVKKALAG
jgi:uncharacterized protein